MKNKNKSIIESQENYKYDFKDENAFVFKVEKGLNEDVIRQISASKQEPEWMLEYRLKAYHKFLEMPLPSFGPDLSDINFEYEVLYTLLEKLPDVMNEGGRVAILTFHSGEDRQVKKSFKAYKKSGDYPEIAEDAIRPSAKERNDNPRSKCAKLRWAKK